MIIYEVYFFGRRVGFIRFRILNFNEGLDIDVNGFSCYLMKKVKNYLIVIVISGEYNDRWERD